MQYSQIMLRNNFLSPCCHILGMKLKLSRGADDSPPQYLESLWKTKCYFTQSWNPLKSASLREVLGREGREALAVAVAEREVKGARQGQHQCLLAPGAAVRNSGNVDHIPRVGILKVTDKNLAIVSDLLQACIALARLRYYPSVVIAQAWQGQTLIQLNSPAAMNYHFSHVYFKQVLAPRTVFCKGPCSGQKMDKNLKEFQTSSFALISY